jgi:hypothetical protein
MANCFTEYIISELYSNILTTEIVYDNQINNCALIFNKDNKANKDIRKMLKKAYLNYMTAEINNKTGSIFLAEFITEAAGKTEKHKLQVPVNKTVDNLSMAGSYLANIDKIELEIFLWVKNFDKEGNLLFENRLKVGRGFSYIFGYK